MNVVRKAHEKKKEISHMTAFPPASTLAGKGSPTWNSKPKKAPKPPRLPEDDAKIVFRLRGGLTIKEEEKVSIQRSVQREAGLTTSVAAGDVFRFNTLQNTLLVSTPSLENANQYGRVKAIMHNGKAYEVVSYVVPPENTEKGIIHGIPTDDTEQDIIDNLVSGKNPSILHARRMGMSNSVVILFGGQEVPYWVRYGNVDLQCYIYKKKVEICNVCGGVGHRADVCPRPNERRCRICNVIDPKEGHECTPSCGVCGKVHPTGDKRCKLRFKTPHILVQRKWEKIRKAHSNKTINRLKAEDFPPLEQRKPRSRSRTPAKKGNREHSKSRATSKPRGILRSKQRIGWVNVVTPHATEKEKEQQDTQQSEISEVLRIVKQLQDENKSLRAHIEKTEKECEQLRRQLQAKTGTEQRDQELTSPPTKRKLAARPRQESAATEITEPSVQFQQEIIKIVTETMQNPTWIMGLAIQIEQLRNSQHIISQDGSQ